MDLETEKNILKEVFNLKGKKTVIMIAHRLTTLENCDLIYKIEEGKILKVKKNEWKDFNYWWSWLYRHCFIKLFDEKKL